MYHLIMLDYSLPDINGPSVASSIKKLFSDAKIPTPYICCCSAHVDEQFKQKALRAGMDSFLSKPISDD